MAKILLFSDIHIHSHKSKIKRLEDCLQTLRWAFQTAVDRGINDVLFLGDLFQHRQKIETLAYFRTFQIFKEYNQLDIVLLLGNHDLWFHDKWDVNSIAPFGSLSNVQIVCEPDTLTVAGLDIDFLPYTRNPGEVIKQLSKRSPVLCGHIAIDDAQLNKLYNTRSEVSVEVDNDMVKVTTDILAGWQRVFLGHYHGEQRINNVEYVGSPLQLNFNEAFQTKHIIILDTETLDVEYVENTFSPKHLIVPANRLAEFDLENNFVRIVVDNMSSPDVVDIRRDLGNKTGSLEFEERKRWEETINHKELQEKFDLANGDVLQRYVQTVGFGSLDQDLLLEFGREICKGDQ